MTEINIGRYTYTVLMDINELYEKIKRADIFGWLHLDLSDGTEAYIKVGDIYAINTIEDESK